jgi:hypothetical protein
MEARVCVSSFALLDNFRNVLVAAFPIETVLLVF